MKMSRLISMVLLGAALVATPVYAQRGGGGRSGGGSSSHGSSYSGGRSSGGGYSSSSRSSSSYSSGRSSSSYSSPSRSSSSYSSSSRSSSSYSSPSRSSSSYSSSSRSSSYSSPSRSSSDDSYRGSYYGGRSDVGSTERGGRSENGSYNRAYSRTGSIPSEIRSRSSQTGRVDAARGEGSSRVVGTSGRPSGIAPAPQGGYARPNNPGGYMPPSHRPMHPAPYFYHPHHHCMVHCHQLYWDPCCFHHWYWPGFWLYCNSYWYDYHVHDVVVVRQYVKDTYKMDLIAYAINGDYMYALVNESDGTYIQIYDQNDKLLAEQKVSRKYCKMEVDAQNGGCWIMKKRDKDPLLFFYADGQLLIYEADK